jgi:carboxypeptidase Taq
MGAKTDHLRALLGEIFDLDRASAVLQWDQQTHMPPGGAEGRAQQFSTLNRLSHDKFVCDEFGATLQAAQTEVAGLPLENDDAALVRRTARDFDKQRRVPSEWVAEFNLESARGHSIWEKARAEADFLQFKPALETIVRLKRAYAEFFRPYEHIYDPLIDDFEPGMPTAQVKAVFDLLRPQQVELVRATKEQGRPVSDAPVRQAFDVEKQKLFGVEVIQKLGYDFNRGRLDTAVHPFTTNFGIDDVRITTRYDPGFFNDALFSTIHECGHALYDQGIAPNLNRTPLAGATSMAVHESQSRMWENFVGRSRPFWVAFYPRLQELFPDALGKVKLADFYRAINKVEPSLIRVDADEATYNLHVMLRFEIEIELMSGTLEVKDLPDSWNMRMRDYLGITPPNDAKGVLQDVHWSEGYIGYFPTYALGNLVAAQLWEQINKDIPDLSAQIEHANFAGLLGWLRENIHRHGARYYPMELLQRVTGQGLTPEPYLRYLRAKFGELYELH